jgi:hypothetical protein
MSTTFRKKLIIPTADLVAEFHAATQEVFRNDTQEIISQIFSLLKASTPFDEYDRNIIELARLRADVVALNGQFIDHCQRAAYHLLVQMYSRAKEYGLFNAEGKIEYLPYLMVGNDVCLDHFLS